MALVPRPHPPAAPHGSLSEILPGIHFVHGTMKLPGIMPVRFSRNMTVVAQGGNLVLINTVRLTDSGLAALDKLGKVTDIIRLGAFHGMDDPFYAERYGAKVWVPRGMRYTAGFDATVPNTYFTPHHEVDEGGTLPIDGAKFFLIKATPTESMLVLPHHGGTVVACDALQNWAKPDEYFSWLGRLMLPRMGFIRAHNVGPAWLKQTKPPKADLAAILSLPFENVLPAHGTPVLGGALGHFRPAIEHAMTRTRA